MFQKRCRSLRGILLRNYFPGGLPRSSRRLTTKTWVSWNGLSQSRTYLTARPRSTTSNQWMKQSTSDSKSSETRCSLELERNSFKSRRRWLKRAMAVILSMEWILRCLRVRGLLVSLPQRDLAFARPSLCSFHQAWSPPHSPKRNLCLRLSVLLTHLVASTGCHFQVKSLVSLLLKLYLWTPPSHRGPKRAGRRKSYKTKLPRNCCLEPKYKRRRKLNDK